MGIKFDMNKDFLFLKGEEKGEKRGKERGKEIGKIKTEISNILNMTAKGLDASRIADLLLLDLKFVQKIQKQVLLKDRVLMALKNKNATPETVAKQLQVEPLLVEVLAEK